MYLIIFRECIAHSSQRIVASAHIVSLFFFIVNHGQLKIQMLLLLISYSHTHLRKKNWETGSTL